MSEIVAPQTYYVYTLAYPDGKIFYVGKGAQGRIADHEREASKGCKCRKCHVIREIWARGKPVQKRIVYETLDESEAFGHERMLIDLYASSLLVNIRHNSYIEEEIQKIEQQAETPQVEKPEKREQELSEVPPLPPENVEAIGSVRFIKPQITEPLDSEQAARMLGVKPRTVINLAKQGKIPAFRVGDLWKFLRSDIQAYIDAQRKQTKGEKPEEGEK
jgi:excisionase family DNA binding protein